MGGSTINVTIFTIAAIACLPELVGGIPTPLKDYESQLGGLFPIYGKIEHVPNRQPESVNLC